MIKENLKGIKRNKTSAFNMKTTVQTDKQLTTKMHMGPPCILCDGTHKLYKCPNFMKMSLCYGCLKQGHSAKDCRHRLTCDICTKRHPTCLHDENYSKDLKGQKHVNMEDTTQNHTLVMTPAMSLHVAREGQSVSTSMIVPVWVSSATNPR